VNENGLVVAFGLQALDHAAAVGVPFGGVFDVEDNS
jgi:hypothetical protein